MSIIRNCIVIILVVLQITMITACKKDIPIEKKEKNVKTVKAGVSSLNLTVQYPSKLKPIEEIVLSPKVFGRVESVNFDIGMNVNKGDILFTLEKKDAEATYNQSLASLASANANYAKTQGYSNPQLAIQFEQTLNQAQIQYDDAKRNYDKVFELYRNLQITKQEIDDAESKMKSSSLQLETAKKNLEVLKNSGIPESSDVALAQVDQSKASMGLSILQLENAVILSPISGTVSIRNIDIGEMVTSNTQAFTIINTDKLIAEINVPGNISRNLKKGQKINVDLVSVSDKSYEGVVDNISPNVDSKTQFYVVKIIINNENKELKPGLFAKASIEHEKKENILTLPNECLVYENGVQYVYAVIDGKIKKKSVKIGIASNKESEILENVKENEYIVREGQSYLNDEDLVKIIATP